MKESFCCYAQNNKENMKQTLRELVSIPAPSGLERKRGEYCVAFLKNAGAEAAYLDGTNNLICPLVQGKSGKWIVFSAHMDTLFPIDTDLTIHEDGNRWICPGIGDDTASLVVLLYGAKFILEAGYINSDDGIMIVGTAGEESGSFGAKAFVDEIGSDNISFFYSFDGNYKSIYPNVVNRVAYEIEVTAPGGHPLGAFGMPNAIEELSKLLVDLSNKCRDYIPTIKTGRNAFNIDRITGGNGNAIAKYARAEVQFRSDVKERVDTMADFAVQYALNHSSDNLRINVVESNEEKTYWSTVPGEMIKEYGEKHLELVKSLGIDARLSLSATDCRYPMHKGIPSLCMGLSLAYEPHTFHDSVEPDSLPKGLEILLAIFEMNGII